MVKRTTIENIRPIGELTAEDWEVAYNKLNARFEKLKTGMKQAMLHMNRAQGNLSDAII